MHTVPFAEAHLEPALAVYNHYVRTSTITFHIEEIDAGAFREQVFFDDERCRSFALFDDGQFVGYCSLAPFHSRCAYRVTATVAVYLDPDATGRGMGRNAVEFLHAEAREAGFHALIACICAENTASVRLFAGLGYEKVAHFREVGHKFGRYLDVVDYEKLLD